MNLNILKDQRDEANRVAAEYDKAIQAYVTKEVEEICKRNKLDYDAGMGAWSCETEIYVVWDDIYDEEPEWVTIDIHDLLEEVKWSEDGCYTYKHRQPEEEDVIYRITQRGAGIVKKEDQERLLDAFKSFRALIGQIQELTKSNFLELNWYLENPCKFTFSVKSKI